MRKTTNQFGDIVYVLALLLGAFAITGSLFLLVIKIFMTNTST